MVDRAAHGPGSVSELSASQPVRRRRVPVKALTGAHGPVLASRNGMIEATLGRTAGQIDAPPAAAWSPCEETLLSALPLAGVFSLVLALHVAFALAAADDLSAHGVCSHRNAAGIAYMGPMMH
ncbi:MAG: hypothetical protein ACOY4R_10710 [Pseudomonadota bacterium]